MLHVDWATIRLEKRWPRIPLGFSTFSHIVWLEGFHKVGSSLHQLLHEKWLESLILVRGSCVDLSNDCVGSFDVSLTCCHVLISEPESPLTMQESWSYTIPYLKFILKILPLLVGPHNVSGEIFFVVLHPILPGTEAGAPVATFALNVLRLNDTDRPALL